MLAWDAEMLLQVLQALLWMLQWPHISLVPWPMSALVMADALLDRPHCAICTFSKIKKNNKKITIQKRYAMHTEAIFAMQCTPKRSSLMQWQSIAWPSVSSSAAIMYCSSFLQRSHSWSSSLSWVVLSGSDAALELAILSWEVDEEKWRRKRRRQHRLIKKMGAAWGGGTVNLSRPRRACIYIYLRKLQAKIAIDAHCFGTCLLQEMCCPRLQEWNVWLLMK